MPSRTNLSHEEREIVRRALLAIVNGAYIPDDVEFEVVFGSTRAEAKKIAEAWPEVDERSEPVRLAINSALNNLLGYPHGMHAERERDVAPKAEIERVFRQWRASL